MTEATIAAVDGLVKRFQGRARWGRRVTFTAVDRVSFAIGAGEALGLVGESGAGKSTIARCLLGLEKPSEGRIELFGEDVAALTQAGWKRVRRDLQAVFQDPKGAMNPRWPVKRTVGEPLRLLTDLPSSAIDGRVGASLEAVGLGKGFLQRFRHQLSGGQQQRVNIARAIAVEPRCIVLDEPVAALDSSVKREIVLLLDKLRRQRDIAYLLISHDLRIVRILCDSVVILFRGRVVEMGPAHIVMASPRHPYTQALLAAQLALPGDAGAKVVVSAGGGEGEEWTVETLEETPRIGDLVEIADGHFVASEAA